MLTCVAAALPLAAAHAIEAPKQQTDASAAAPVPQATVTPTDEAAFYVRLQRVTHWRQLRDLNVPQAVIDDLARGAVDRAVATLSEAAAQGQEEANIALVRVQHWCSRIGATPPRDLRQQIDQLASVLPPERVARAAGVLQAEAAFSEGAARSCRNARFDYEAIEDRLRDAADLGKPASATELARFVRDPRKRDALLEKAAKQQYAPAMYALATRRVIEVQRGERTSDIASIRSYLKHAGRTMPQAKVDLANCMALGCDGHPADSSSAQAFGIDAARDGEPSAFLSMVRMPWGRRMPRAQLLAWQYFGDRLNEAGCMGDAYIAHARSFAQAITLLTRDADEQVIAQAREQAERLWAQNARRAMREQGCGEPEP